MRNTNIQKFLQSLNFCRINGPFAAFTSYLSEFHCAKYRARIMILRGLIVHSANLVMPLLAWAVFPLNFELQLFNGYIGKLLNQHSRTKTVIFSSTLLEYISLPVRTS